MMGSIDDPPDGKAVAGTVFAAVTVYAVCLSSSFLMKTTLLITSGIGFPRLLRSPSLSTYKGKSEGCDHTELSIASGRSLEVWCIL